MRVYFKEFYIKSTCIPILFKNYFKKKSHSFGIKIL